LTLDSLPPLTVRSYGSSGPPVLVLHGGPGSPGYLAPLARALADRFLVLEPFQRGSSDTPLTVARHVEDLDALLRSRFPDRSAALVGHSWGAMLALAQAAAHPHRIRSVALIGCGTFDGQARRRMREILDRRTDDALRRCLESLAQEIPDPDERLRVRGSLIDRLYLVDPVEAEEDNTPCDARAHQETWEDMLRLQREQVYPAAFATITAPVLMLHGAEDPHPGRMIRTSLAPHLPQLEYREWPRCGHYPWLERAVRDEFLEALRTWLAGHPENPAAAADQPRRVGQ